MREIKFRAWAKHANIMFSDKVTDLVLHFNGEINSIDEIGMIAGCFFIKDLELMQYTGLKDKNGVEIYEGDKLSVISSTIDGECSTWETVIESILDFYIMRNLCYANEIKIIGNIYEDD